MTEITFHFNAPDKVAHTCRLLRKAVASGAKVVVTGEGGLLRELDVALWTFSALDFLPHCLAVNAPPEVLAASPVVLAETSRDAPHQHLLVNLGTGVPEGFERFERMVEVVTIEDDARLHGRQRWKHYADRGYAIARYDVATREIQ